MGSNYHSAWIVGSNFNPTEMEGRLDDLDLAITYARKPIVACDGELSFDSSTNTLTWSDVIRIWFVREDGQSILNTIAAGNIVITSGYFIYVTLNETNNTVLTVSQAAITTGTASNFKANTVLVLGIHNSVIDEFYCTNLFQALKSNETNPFDVHLFYPGIPEPATTMLYVPLARAVSFPANFSGSYATAEFAATAEFILEIEKNEVQVGTITFADSAYVGTFASSGGNPVSFVAGDEIGIVSESVSSADATLANIGIVLAGTR